MACTTRGAPADLRAMRLREWRRPRCSERSRRVARLGSPESATGYAPGYGGGTGQNYPPLRRQLG